MKSSPLAIKFYHSGCVYQSSPSLEESPTVASAAKTPKVAPKVDFYQLRIAFRIMMTPRTFWDRDLQDPPWQHLWEYLVQGKKGRVQM